MDFSISQDHQMLADSLRRAGQVVELTYGGSLKKRLKRANSVKARVAVLLGEEELARGEATVRNLDSGEQQSVALGVLAERLAAL